MAFLREGRCPWNDVFHKDNAGCRENKGGFLFDFGRISL
jgi:hypothetical protein